MCKYCHLALLSLLLLSARTLASNLTWTSPAQGDIYGPGDVIIGQWDTDQAAIAPTFSLCSVDSDEGITQDGDNCGSSVFPTVVQDLGSYRISLSVPNVSAESHFCLQMQDNGQTVLSPPFLLSPISLPDATDDSPSDSASPAAVSANVRAPVRQLPNLEETRMPTPIAAFAVPLTLIGIIFFAAIALYAFTRFKATIKEDTNKDIFHPLPSRSKSRGAHPSRFTSRTSSVTSRLEKAEGAFPQSRSEIPVRRRESRQTTRDGFRSLSRSSNTTTRRAGARVPASLFKTAAPGRSKFTSGDDEQDIDADDDTNARVNDSVLSRYLMPSPVPPPISMIPQLSKPARLHVRKAASDVEKDLPVRPRDNMYG